MLACKLEYCLRVVWKDASFLIIYTWFQVGADIVKRALSYPLKLIAKNAGVNGSVVSEKVFNWLNFLIIN